ncbi:GyrI-like domain-containing protein [Streptococcus merionis]|uniref:GyrI-like domain-containing protein n=1 Tax=Streptococcus merionis TaxID=400065 RepID=UPI0035124594
MIEKFVNVPIIYKRRVGVYGEENHVLMASFKQFLKEQQLFNENSVLVGIALDNPVKTRPENCRYDVGLIVDDTGSNWNLPQRLLENGVYLVIEVEHIVESVRQFWSTLSNYLAGYQIDSERPIIERYAVHKVQEGYCEFCVPILSN